MGKKDLREIGCDRGGWEALTQDCGEPTSSCKRGTEEWPT